MRTQGHRAQLLNLTQRHMLMLRELDALRLHRCGERLKRGVGGDAHTHWQVVYERTDDRFHAGQLAWPAGIRCAKHHVIIASLLRQQNGPRALYERVQRAFQTAGKPIELRCSDAADCC